MTAVDPRREFALSAALNEMEDALIAAGIYEPGHDGWDGCAGVEIRERPFEPYPHQWDYSLGWCRVSWAMKLHDVGARRFNPNPGRGGWQEGLRAPYDEAEDIPPQIFARAIGLGWRYLA
jgi:hypothetical protein